MHPLIFTALLAPLAPLVVALCHLRRLTIGQRILMVLSLFFLLNQGVGVCLTQLGISNYPLFHLHVIVETSVFGFLFWVEGVTFKGVKLQFGVSAVIALAGIANACCGEGMWNPPSTFLAAESTLMILVACLYFLKTYREMIVVRVEQEFLFWVSLGFLIFFAGTLLLSFTVDYILLLEDQVFFDVFLIRAFLIILTNICYAIGMSCKAHPQKS